MDAIVKDTTHLSATQIRNLRTLLLVSQLDLQAIGMRIKQARKEAGLTQEALADLIGVRARTIQHWEAGSLKDPPYRHFMKLEEALGRTMGWFLRGEESPRDREGLEAVLVRLETIAERLEEALGPQGHARSG